MSQKDYTKRQNQLKTNPGTALEEVGVVCRHSAGIDMFLDGPDATAHSVDE
ncbi:MAG: hypothetical protein R3C02_03015 [Planctomycetaceae bacterium]